MHCDPYLLSFFFFNDTATTEIYTLSLHDALPISHGRSTAAPATRREPSGPEALGEKAHDPRAKLLDRERLLEKIVGAARHDLVAHLAFRMRRHGQDSDRRRLLLGLQPTADFETVEPRHPDVEDEDVGAEGPDLDQGLIAVSGDRHDGLRDDLLDGLAQRRQQGWVVVDDQDARPRRNRRPRVLGQTGVELEKVRLRDPMVSTRGLESNRSSRIHALIALIVTPRRTADCRVVR